MQFHKGLRLSSRVWSNGYATIASDGNPTPKFPYPSHPNPTAHQIFHLATGASQKEIKSRCEHLFIFFAFSAPICVDYELVRLHHPDSTDGRRLPPSVAHARFRNIKASYDYLRGHTLSPHPNARQTSKAENFDPYQQELARRRRAWEASGGHSHNHKRYGDPHARSSNWDAGFDGEGQSFAGSDRPPNWTRTNWEGFGAPKDSRSNWDPNGRRERLILAFGVSTLLAGLFPTLPFALAEVFIPIPLVPKDSQPDVKAPPSSASSCSSSPAAHPPPVKTSSFMSNPFTYFADRTHESASSALKECRRERNEHGAERREGLRRRAKEIKDQPIPGPPEATETPTTTST